VSVQSGVPQGSVLGPILFSLFINDIAEVCCGTVNNSLFADDPKLFSESTLDSLGNDLQQLLSMLQSWCSAWQLSVNIEKCNVLHLGFNNASVQYEYNNTVISDVSTVCDLGVDVDSSLKFDGQINRIAAKAHLRIRILFRGFFGGAENDGHENDGPEIDGPDSKA